MLAGAVWRTSLVLGVSAEARIDYIEVDGPRFVNIHFDTLPNRTYALQYRTVLNATNTTGWTNLFVAPSVPFNNHYVVSDSRTNRQRFYRLRVTP